MKPLFVFPFLEVTSTESGTALPYISPWRIENQSLDKYVLLLILDDGFVWENTVVSFAVNLKLVAL